MKRSPICLALLVALVVTAALPADLSAKERKFTSKKAYSRLLTKTGAEPSNQYYIELAGRGPADLAAAVQAAGGRLTHDLSDLGAATAVSDAKSFARKLARTAGIRRVTRDLRVQWRPDAEGVASAQQSPSAGGHVADPNAAFFRACQWNLDQIDAAGAWEQGEFGAGATVAVLDGGVSGDPSPAGGSCSPHGDLVGQVVGNVSMLSSPRDFCHDVLGVPDQTSPCDFDFHGTFIAGQIAAHGLGIAGVAPDAKIYGVKVLDCLGDGTFGDVIAGILHAANQPGVDVINMSLGGYFPKADPASPFGPPFGAGPLIGALNQAVNYAQGVRGKLVVSSAGNGIRGVGQDLQHDGNFASLPAEAGNGIGAWAGDFNGDLASYSNHGVSGAELGAGGGDATPGVFIPDCPLPPFAHSGIVSVCSPDTATLPFFLGFGCDGGSYLFPGTGTSFSAPIVAAVGALAKGRYPWMNGNQLKSHLERTADDIGPRGVDNLFSHGRVNASNAVQ